MAEHHISEAAVYEYIRYLQQEERSTSTIEKYSRDLHRFAAWLETRESKTVSKAVVVVYKSELSARYSPASVNCMLAALNGFFSYMGWNECRVKPLRVQRLLYGDPGRELSRAEYIRLVEAAKARKDERLALLMQTLCGLGLRVSELRSITFQAVQCGRAEIHNKGKCRVIFLPRELSARLRAYCKGRHIRNGPVFITRSGRPLDRSNIWTMLKSLCKEAKVAPGKVFPHNLRHLFARCFYKQMKDIEHLASILGHSNINTTRIYTRTSGAEYRRQMEKLALIL